jgi:hypothetical protein
MFRVVTTTVVAVIGIIVSAENARAECRGLTVPPPEDLNVCRSLVEDLVIPPVIRLEPTCNIEGAECLLLPHCCVPGACLGFPECVITEQIIEKAEQVFHAGDTYCDVDEVSGHQLLVDFIDKRIADPATLATGGASSVIVKHAGAELDEIACKHAIGLEGFKEIVHGFMALSDFPGDAFSDVDVEAASVVSKRDSGLPIPVDGYAAITLGSLIVVEDYIYDTLVNVSWNWPGSVKTWDDKHMFVLLTMMHELVHVRQYRELGRENFLNSYLHEVLAEGYADAAFEAEAYDFSDARGASGSSSWAYQAASGVYSGP